MIRIWGEKGVIVGICIFPLCFCIFLNWICIVLLCLCIFLLCLCIVLLCLCIFLVWICIWMMREWGWGGGRCENCTSGWNFFPLAWLTQDCSWNCIVSHGATPHTDLALFLDLYCFLPHCHCTLSRCISLRKKQNEFHNHFWVRVKYCRQRFQRFHTLAQRTLGKNPIQNN